MKNIINDLKNKKEELSSKIFPSDNEELNKDNINLLYHLLKEGQLVYVHKGFDINSLADELTEFLIQKDKIVTFQSLEHIILLHYKSKSGIKNKLGINEEFHLFLTINEDKLIYDIKPTAWIKSNEKKESILSNIGNIINESYDEELSNFISNKIIIDFFAKNNFDKIRTENLYIENITTKEKIILNNRLSEDEIILAFLDINSVKKHKQEEAINIKLKWKFILTNQSVVLIGINKRNEIEYFDNLSGFPMMVKKEFGRKPIFISDFEWLSTRSNDTLYIDIQKTIGFSSENRLKEFARLNWINAKDDENSRQTSIYLLNKLLETNKNPFDELSLLLLNFAENGKDVILDNYIENDKLISLLNKILDENELSEKLLLWIKEWKISHINEVAVTKMLLNAAKTEIHYEKLLLLHDKVRDRFLKKNKDKLNIILFDIDYCQHLIDCNKNKEAIKIIKKRLKNLPDETISDILPPKDIDLTGVSGGQILRVKLLELLAKAESEKESPKIIAQIAMLQPLSKTRLENLNKVSSGDFKDRVENLLEIIEPEKIKQDNKYTNLKFNNIPKELIEKQIRHKASQKNGAFNNFQKWLANIEIPDYSIVKSFSERVIFTKYPQIMKIITDTKVAFNLEVLECFIARGEKSVGISSYEANPPFIIIGGDHIDKESPNYMTFSELQFIIGVEMAHLYFKHSRITSSDVWKGAMEKGYWVLDTLLSIIPAVGVFGKSLQGITKLNTISSLLQKSSKLGSISSNSKEILDATSQIVGIYKSTSKKEDKTNKENELLATSRIMQLSSDRAAMLFCANINSAIRAIFLSSKHYANELQTIEKYGLTKFLLKKDEEGLYIHQELAIRLSNIFSFYLSDEYMQLREKLIYNDK